MTPIASQTAAPPHDTVPESPIAPASGPSVSPLARPIPDHPLPATAHSAPRDRSAGRAFLFLGVLWLLLFAASLTSPPVLDDADGTHANAARQMALSGDWVTLRVNNVRYLEKAPLPYWIVAVSLRLFGMNAFATHLPQALAVLLLTLLGHRWAREAFGDRAAFYTGLAILTSAGVFLFTRIFIPDILLSLLLATALYTFLRSLDAVGAPHLASEMRGEPPRLATHVALYPYTLWTSLALAVLTKGLVALVFVFGTAALYLAVTGEYRQWRRLRPVSGALLFLAIAAPWHILAGVRNTGGMNGHGFFWFYFINEHVFRFLGQRIPRDYNKLPGYLYWSLHLVWLFPWALFGPLSVTSGWAVWNQRRNAFRHAIKTGRLPEPRPAHPYGRMFAGAVRYATPDLAGKTVLLACIFSAVVLIFFSISTNQEYYTFPTYLPILMLIAAALQALEKGDRFAVRPPRRAVVSGPGRIDPAVQEMMVAQSNLEERWSYALRTANPAMITFAHASVTAIGLAISAALAYGLWASRNLPFVPDVGDLLAHRGVGDYTLSMSALFDLTGPSFAALRLPTAIALCAFAIGPATAWMLRHKRRHLASTVVIALTSALFLIAAHIALVRFAPMLSSEDFASRIKDLEATHAIAPGSPLLLYGDQAYGSSIPFYLNRPLSQPALLVDGRSSSMLFGSTFPDAAGLFLTPAELVARWGTGPRKLLFVPLERRDEVDRLLPHALILEETSGKALLTDRPLDH